MFENMNTADWGGAIGGLGSAMMRGYAQSRKREAEENEAELEAAYKQAQIDKMKAETGLYSGMGGLTLGDVVPGMKKTAQGGIPVSPKSAPFLAVQGANTAFSQKQQQQRAADLTTGEATKLSGAVEGAGQLSDLGKLWKNKGVGNTGLMAGSALRVIPSQIAQRINPEVEQYNIAKRRVAESALRAATGAAAPPAEQIQYQVTLLPAAGDTPQAARAKVEAFYDDLLAKGRESVNRLRAEGKLSDAARVEAYLNQSMGRDKDEMLASFGLISPTATQSPRPTQNPASLAFE